MDKDIISSTRLTSSYETLRRYLHWLSHETPLPLLNKRTIGDVHFVVPGLINVTWQTYDQPVVWLARPANAVHFMNFLRGILLTLRARDCMVKQVWSCFIQYMGGTCNIKPWQCWLQSVRLDQTLQWNWWLGGVSVRREGLCDTSMASHKWIRTSHTSMAFHRWIHTPYPTPP